MGNPPGGRASKSGFTATRASGDRSCLRSGLTLVVYKTFWLILAQLAAPTTPREMAKRSAAVSVGRRAAPEELH